MPVSEKDALMIASAVASTRPESATKQFPGGLGGMVAALLFIFMAAGAFITVLIGVVVSVFGFIASHFFGQFTELADNFNDLTAEFRQLQSEVRSSNEAYLELKQETKDRHTSADDAAAQESDTRARDYLRRELIQEITRLENQTSINTSELKKRSEYMNENDDKVRQSQNEIEKLQERLKRVEGSFLE